MYKHKCEPAKSAEYPQGISITARVLANLKPVDGDRYFWVDDPHGDLFPDDTKVDELYCLDCDEAFAQVVRGMDLAQVESMLQDGELNEVEWMAD